MADHTLPNKVTRDEEANEARQSADPGREPTAEEAAAADSNTLDPSVASHEQEMNERGANQQGEGRLP
jgi:hypothetical protein